MITIVVDNVAAPQAGADNVECDVPGTRAEFQTQAATAISSQGGFLEVTLVKSPGVSTVAEKKLINVNKVRAVI